MINGLTTIVPLNSECHTSHNTNDSSSETGFRSEMTLQSILIAVTSSLSLSLSLSLSVLWRHWNPSIQAIALNSHTFRIGYLVVTLCCLAGRYQCFKRTWWLHLRGRNVQNVKFSLCTIKGQALITYAGVEMLFYYYLVCEAIGTAANPGLLCHPRVIVKMIVEKQMECRLAGETYPSATFVHHKIPHDQTRVWTRAAAVGSRRLTAWAMARLEWRCYYVRTVGGSSVSRSDPLGKLALYNPYTISWGLQSQSGHCEEEKSLYPMHRIESWVLYYTIPAWWL
jgi:hypothetical protein